MRIVHAVRRYVFSGCFLLLWAGCATPPPREPIHIQLRKPEDRARIETSRKGVTVSIRSPSGIGQAVLFRDADTWPSPLILHLQLNNLEGFQMNNGRIRFETGFHRTRRVPYWRVATSRYRQGPPAETLEADILRIENGFEIKVPEEILEGSPPFITFSWVDWYRQ